MHLVRRVRSLCVPGEPAYEACLTEVERFLYSKVMRASEAADVHFYAFSFYYDRAVDLGLIGKKVQVVSPRAPGLQVQTRHLMWITH